MDAQLAQALADLRDIHLPPPISWWPLAPGWWALLALAALSAVTALWLLRRRRGSVRRHALRELGALEARHRAGADPVELAIALTALLRRVTLANARQADIASLYGDPWVDYLTEDSRGQRSPRVAQQLIDSAYGGEHALTGEPHEWLAFVRSWIQEVT